MIEDTAELRALLRDTYGSEAVDGISYTGLLGLIIAILRQKCGLSQSQLSARSGVSQPTISRIEIGAADITAPQMDALATALGTRPSAIFDSVDELRTILSEEKIDVVPKLRNLPRNLVPGAGVAVTTGILFGPLGLLAGSVIGTIIANRKEKD